MLLAQEGEREEEAIPRLSTIRKLGLSRGYPTSEVGFEGLELKNLEVVERGVTRVRGADW